METIKKNIAANLAYYRKLNNISQKELAEILNIKKNTTISTWERGASLPDVDTLFTICQTLKISLTDLFGCDTLSSDSLTVHGIEKDIILAYRKADEIGKAVILRSLGLDNPKDSKDSKEKRA